MNWGHSTTVTSDSYMLSEVQVLETLSFEVLCENMNCLRNAIIKYNIMEAPLSNALLGTCCVYTMAKFVIIKIAICDRIRLCKGTINFELRI